MAKIKGVDNVMVTKSMIDPKDGKVELVPVDGKGPRIRRWPIDAKEIATQGNYKLAASPTRDEQINNQNTEEEESTSDQQSENTEEEKPVVEPEEEFNYDVPASAPKRS